jgi:hypothetical protein
MSLHSVVRHGDDLIEDEHRGALAINWAPQHLSPHFRRRATERAMVMQVSANGALIRARASGELTNGTRISIGRGHHRGLVAIRSLELLGNGDEADYGVQFLWLDPELQVFFDGSVTTDVPFELGWR